MGCLRSNSGQPFAKQALPAMLLVCLSHSTPTILFQANNFLSVYQALPGLSQTPLPGRNLAGYGRSRNWGKSSEEEEGC